MKPTRKECGCTSCGLCNGTGKFTESIYPATMQDKEITCPDCEGKGNFAKCFDHIKGLLDADDISRHAQYIRKQAA